GFPYDPWGDRNRNRSSRQGAIVSRRDGLISSASAPSSPSGETSRADPQQGGTPMPMRWGPGPVFIHESIAATRRWQLYALRSLFVPGLRAGLARAGLLLPPGRGRSGGNTTPINHLASLGQYFSLSTAPTHPVLVPLIPPAATAGAICLDRAQ